VSLVLVLFVLLLPVRGWGVSPDIFLHASRESGIPVELLLAVSHVESRFNPHALNVAGRSFFPSSRSEAERVLRRSGDNVDVGLMQVNWGLWGKKLGVSKLDLLNPEVNVFLGAKILRYYVRARNDWWQGVGFYHSARVERQLEYIEKVWRSYSGIVARMRS
jgi:hypothetical protein